MGGDAHQSVAKVNLSDPFQSGHQLSTETAGFIDDIAESGACMQNI